MSTPGWYPDPTGAAGQFRYWDGSVWTTETATNANAPLPGSKARDSAGSRWSTPIWLTVAIIAVVLIALIVWLTTNQGSDRYDPVPEDSNSEAPTVSGWDETSKATPPPTDAGMVACPRSQVTDVSEQTDSSRLRSGRLSVSKIDGWFDDYMYLDWISDSHSQSTEVRLGWFSNIFIGQLNTEDGFTLPNVSARQTIECYGSSDYYDSGYIDFVQRVDLIDEETTVDDYYAWHLRAEVQIVSTFMPEIEGDVVDIYVVDLGDPDRMAIFISCFTIGDTERQKLVEAAIASLRVD